MVALSTSIWNSSRWISKSVLELVYFDEDLSDVLLVLLADQLVHDPYVVLVGLEGRKLEEDISEIYDTLALTFEGSHFFGVYAVVEHLGQDGGLYLSHLLSTVPDPHKLIDPSEASSQGGVEVILDAVVSPT